MKKKVLIIGAGPSGLIAVKEFSANSEAFEVVCMEELSVVGGLWNYSPLITQPDHPTGSNYTAIYKNLRTNLPRQIMNYSDIPFPSDLPSFIHHSDVKKYLWNYSKHHHLDRYIRFNTRVDWVRPKEKLGGQDEWQVEAVDVLSNKTDSYHFHIVVVCNGHFTKAIYPKGIKGMDTFEGSIIHSQHYRDPEEYRGKRVMVVGAGPSGVDIVTEIFQAAKQTFLSHRIPVKVSVHDSVQQVGEITEFIGRDIIINPYNNGSTRNYCSLYGEMGDEDGGKLKLERVCEVDVVIFCTGFSFSFPFLNADCGVCVSSQETVDPLYKGLICLGNQSLCFIGLQNRILPFLLFEQQAKFLKSFYEGKFKIPKYGRELLDMVRKDEEAMEKYGINIVLYKYQMADYQWLYIDELAEMAGFETIPRIYEKLYKLVAKSRKESLFEYKDIEYEMGADDFWVRSQKKFDRNA